MDYTVEIIVFVIIVVLVASKPEGFMDLGNNVLGRALLLLLIVCLAMKSTIGGFLGALLLVVVSESLIEGMDDKKGDDKKDDDKKDKKDNSIKTMFEKLMPTSDKKDKAKDKKKKKDEEDGSKEKNEDDGNDESKKNKEETKEKLSQIKGADLVSLTEKFSKLRSLADAINKS